MENIDYKQLVKALLDENVTQKAAGTVPTFQPGHGNGGLFSNAALDPALYGAFILPNQGLYAQLPKYPTQLEYLVAGIVTGITATTGSEPTGLCDDPPYAGLMKLCQQAYPLGRFSRMSRVGELDAMGKMLNRGEHNDFTLYGAGDNLPGVLGQGGAANPLTGESDKMLFELAVAWLRDFAPQIYTGNPSSNTGAGGTKYFNGLDILINTGYRDTISTVVCPAADSVVASFGSVNVGTAGGGAALVNMVTQMIWELWLNRASEMGLAPVVGALVMRPQLFHILTSYWACTYSTYRCTTSDNSASAVMATDALQMRAEMRQGSYLLVDDQKIPVIQDSAVAYTSAAGVDSSKIYFVPLTVLGGRPVTYLEYYNYDTPNGFMKGATDLAPGDSFRTSNSGMYAWHKKPPSNWCVQVLGKTEQRLLLRTPQIAGVITDIAFTPFLQERDWNTDGTYWVDGGGVSSAKTVYNSPNAR